MLIEDKKYQYAGFWTRVWAGFLDTVFFLLLTYPILYLFYGNNFMDMIRLSWNFLSVFVNFIFPFLLAIALWKYKDATPGKILIKAKIVDKDSLESPTLGQYFIRYFAYLISILPFGLGFFWIAWDKKKQGFHDKLSNTIVIEPYKQEKGSWLKKGGIIIASIFGIGFMALLGLSLASKFNLIPNKEVYLAKNLPISVQDELVSMSLIKNTDNLVLYAPEGTFSFTASGTAITKDKIVYFFDEDEKDNIELYFKDIYELNLKVNPLALNVSLIEINAKSDANEIFFYIVTKTLNQDEIMSTIQALWEDKYTRGDVVERAL